MIRLGLGLIMNMLSVWCVSSIFVFLRPALIWLPLLSLPLILVPSSPVDGYAATLVCLACVFLRMLMTADKVHAAEINLAA